MHLYLGIRSCWIRDHMGVIWQKELRSRFLHLCIPFGFANHRPKPFDLIQCPSKNCEKYMILWINLWIHRLMFLIGLIFSVLLTLIQQYLHHQVPCGVVFCPSNQGCYFEISKIISKFAGFALTNYIRLCCNSGRSCFGDIFRPCVFKVIVNLIWAIWSET